MWNLLSPGDATSGSSSSSGDGDGGGGSGSGRAGDSSNSGKRSGSAVPPVATTMAESETKPSDGTAGIGAVDSRRTGGDGHGAPDLLGNSGAANDEDGGTLPDIGRLVLTGGGRGAVRLVQTVAAAQTPCRYAAVLHFWDVVSDEDGGSVLAGSHLFNWRGRVSRAWKAC